MSPNSSEKSTGTTRRDFLRASAVLGGAAWVLRERIFTVAEEEPSAVETVSAPPIVEAPATCGPSPLGTHETWISLSDQVKSARSCELLPGYPVSKKIAVIINGDPNEERHVMNTVRAMAVLKEKFGFRDFHIAADHALRVPELLGNPNVNLHQFPETRDMVSRLFTGMSQKDYVRINKQPGTTAGVDAILSSLPLEKDALVFFYITGHGAEQFSDGCFALSDGSCYPLSTMVMNLRRMKEKGARGFFVMDQCYSGTFPDAIIESGIEGVAMSPGARGEQTACQFHSPPFFEAMARCYDLNGDGVSEPTEWFQVAMAAYQLGKGDSEFGHFAQTKPELTLENFNAVMGSPRTVVINIRTKACGTDCFEHTETLNQMMGSVGEQVAVFNLSADKNQDTAALLKKLGLGSVTRYPVTLIRRPDGQAKRLDGRADLPTVLKSLISLGVRQNIDVYRHLLEKR